MNTLEIALKVGKEFENERAKQYKDNPLANTIRSEWPASLNSTLSSRNSVITARASAGIGAWNASPFMALLDGRITISPKKGYYPVFLYERGFESFCLVMAQGADQLKSTLGTKEALQELRSRAVKIRAAATGWESKGFSAGPFQTYSRGNSALGRIIDDPWAVSVAFGKRYLISEPPSVADFHSDINAMLDLYDKIFRHIGITFAEEEDIAEDLAASGELPKNGAIGLDGALKIDYHKKIERRERNTKLVKDIKAELGCTCQGCGVALESVYGAIGKGLIDAHHLTPLSQAPIEGVHLTADDFAVLCPTCHRIIHRLGCPPLEKLREIVNSKLAEFYGNIKTKKRLA